MARRSAAGWRGGAGRAGGVDELLEVEGHPLPLGRVEVVRLGLLEEELGGQQVHVLEGAVGRVLVPLRRLEPLVAGA
jgi:hypothetical protein